MRYCHGERNIPAPLPLGEMPLHSGAYAKTSGVSRPLALSVSPCAEYTCPRKLTVGIEVELFCSPRSPETPDEEVHRAVRTAFGEIDLQRHPQFSAEYPADLLEVKNLWPAADIGSVIGELREHMRFAGEVLARHGLVFLPSGANIYRVENWLSDGEFVRRLAEVKTGLLRARYSSSAATQFTIGNIGCGDALLFLHRALGRVGILFTALTANSAIAGGEDTGMMSARMNLRGTSLDGGGLAEIIRSGMGFEEYVRRADRYCGAGGLGAFRGSIWSHNRPIRLRIDHGHCLEFGFCDTIPTLARTGAIARFLVALIRTILERCYVRGEEFPYCFPDEFDHADLATNVLTVAKAGLDAPFITRGGTIVKAREALTHLMDWVGEGHELLREKTPAELVRERIPSHRSLFGGRMDRQELAISVQPLVGVLEAELDLGREESPLGKVMRHLGPWIHERGHDKM